MAGRKKGGPKTGGRKAGIPNKATREIRGIAQQYGPAAIKKLAILGGLMPGGKGAADSEQARVSAITQILDRGYGKATQPVSGPDGGPIQTVDLSKLSDAQLVALEPVLGALVAAGGDAGAGKGGDPPAG